jgi:hypothetical protein
MGRLPPAEDRAWVLDELARLVAQGGEAPLLARPRRPDAVDFPDPWTGDHRSLEVLVRRILGHAGLGHLTPTLRVYEGDRAVDGVERDGTLRFRHEGAAAWFGGLDGRRVWFGCANETLTNAGEGLIGTLGHEVAHAWRAAHGVVVPDLDEEEALTDLTAVYLGFGVFLANNSLRFRTGGTDGGGGLLGHQWRTERFGYLTPECLSYAFAAQLLARREGCWATWRWLRLLEADQRGHVRVALAELRPADTLRERLHLGHLDDPPPVPL